MVEGVTAERLVRLRVLLAGALAAATDQSVTGRHISVIFLDGVSELALHLASDQLDLDVTAKHGFDDVYAMVAGELGVSWNRRSAKGVRELHRARNNLQHHGVLPDADHVPVWAADVDGFVHSLVRAAFGEDLASLTATEAIGDDDLRSRLSAAEAAISQGDFAGALVASKRAVDTAVVRFRSLRGRSASTFNRFGSEVRRLREFQEIDQALNSLEQFVDIAYLATDPGEWLWLEEVTTHRNLYPEPTAEDARRALSFALSWILRFEAFVARYPLRGRADTNEPDLDTTYEQPRIAKVFLRDEPADDRDSIVLELTVDGEPPDWLGHVYAAARTMQQAKTMPEAAWVKADWRTHKIELELPDEIEPKSVRALADELLRRTHEEFERVLEMRRETRDEENQVAERYDRVLDSSNAGLITGVRAGARHSGGFTVWVRTTAADSAPARLIQAALDGAVSLPGHHILFRDDELIFEDGVLAPEDVVPALERAVADARERAVAEHEEAEASRLRRAALTRTVRDAFADISS